MRIPIRMKKLLFAILLFYTTSQAQQLADDIYHNLDVFTSNGSLPSLEELAAKTVNYNLKNATEEDHMALVVTYYNLGYYYGTYNKPLKSIFYYEASWKHYTSQNIFGYDIVSHCLIPLSVLYTKQSDFKNAENILNQCISIAETTNNEQQIISSIISLSVVYHNTSKHSAAITLLKNTLTQYNPNKKQRAIIRNNIASNLIALKRYKEAVKYLKQNLKNNPKTHFTTYKSLAYIYMQEKEFKQAHSYFDLAKKQLRYQTNVKSRDFAKLYYEEAELYLKNREVISCKKSLKKALQFLLPSHNFKELPSKELLYPENSFIPIFNLYGSISDSLEEALLSYDLSLYTSSLLHQKWTSQETKNIHQNAVKNRTEKCIKLLYNAYQETKNPTYIKRAFQYMEKSKAAVLREHSNKKYLLNKHPSDSLLLKEQKLQQQQEIITDVLLRAQLKQSSTSVIQELTTKLNLNTLAINNLKNKINPSYPINNDTIALQKLQQKLNKDSAILISYFFGKEELYQFICTKNSLKIKSIPLNPNFYRTLKGYLTLFENAAVINNNVSDFTTLAYATYTLLNFKVAQDYTNIIVIPDGILNFVSFESLLTKTTNSTLFSNMPFVVKNHRIAYNTNTHFYLEKKPTNDSNTLLGFFPVFKNSPQELSYSIDEANNIKKEVSATFFMNENATKANFIENAAKYSILHLSTHAESGNFVIPASIQFHDDLLFLKELYSLNFSPNLVVLSACETGIGKSIKGEGVMSIARGFQYAGARSVLFSLWKINDRSTAEIMTSFYSNYNSSSSAFIANHTSKLAYLENNTISNPKKSPYYWNAFVYYGSISKVESKIHYWIIAGILILFIVFLGLKSKSKWLL